MAFTDKDENFLEIQLCTTRFIGSSQTAKRVIAVFEKYGNPYLPEKWDIEDRERPRYRFENAEMSKLLDYWTTPQEWKNIFFSRRHPFEIDSSVDIQRFSRAKFNYYYSFIDERYFQDSTQEQRLVSFATDLSTAIRADYGYIAHAKQSRRQSHALTPAERLPGIYWANFFGRPYIDFFGREKLLATPCYEVREVSDDLILLITAERLAAPEMIEHDDIVNRVKSYLDQNAFAGPNFPEEKCAVPPFDFSELRPTDGQKQTPEESLRELREKLLAQGAELVEETEDRLVLRNTDGFVILVDKRSNEVSVDTTGEYLLSRLNISERTSSGKKVALHSIYAEQIRGRRDSA